MPPERRRALLVGAERRAAHRVVDAPEELLPVLRCRLRHDHGELVAADAARDVDGANRLAQPIGCLREHPVAGQVPDLVVDRLEVVEVEDDRA